MLLKSSWLIKTSIVNLFRNVYYFCFVLKFLSFQGLVPKSGVAKTLFWEAAIKKSVLRNFAKFTGKHLCQSLIFNKVAGLRQTLEWQRRLSPLCLRSATLLKKKLWHRCFPVYFCEISKNTVFTGHLWAPASLIWEPFLIKLLQTFPVLNNF